jgi:serine/threonine-protein kinase
MEPLLCPSCGRANSEFDSRCAACGSALLGSTSATSSSATVFDGQPAISQVSQYKLLRPLGRGGMGVVYLAQDVELGREVALKFLRHRREARPADEARFRREAQAAASLDHPSIGTIYEVGEHEGQRFLAMAYYDGTTLAQLLAGRPDRRLALPEAASIAGQLASALAAAHAAGIVHRDLKPENVMVLPDGRVKLLDFGLARWVDSGGVTEAGMAVGTAAYMAPEQLQGLRISTAADLWALGMVLYEMLAGRRAFGGERQGMIHSILFESPLPLREGNADVPAVLETIVARCLAKEPRERPSAAAVAAELQASGLWAGSGASGAVVPVPRRLPLVAGLALATALGIFIAWSLRAPRPAQLPRGPREPLYVAVARPEIGLGAAREEVTLAAAALQTGSLRALTALEGIAALSPGAPEPGEPAPTVQRLSRLLAAEEVLTASLDCQAHQCQAVLRRQRGSDGKILGSTAPFEVPLDDLHLLDTAAAAYLKPLYAGFPTRPEASQLQVRSEDYQRFLRAQRTWQEERPADLRPLLAELDQIRAGSPLFLEAYLLEARIEGNRFFQTRDAKGLDHALGLLAEARRLAPGDPLPLVTLSSVALNGGRLADAEEALRELEQRLPGDVRTLHERALLSEQKGDHRQALELLRAAVERRPSAVYSLDLANLELRQGETPAARRTLEGLLQRLPGHAGGETLLAFLELETGSPARAAELYEGLARRQPGIAVFANLGASQLLLGNYAEAASSLERACSLAPKSYAAVLNLGDIDILLGRKSEAESLYRRSLELMAQDPAPENWQLLAAKAQAQAHLGRRTEAAATIQQAVIAAPNNPEVAYDAALVYCVIGDTASALASADRALTHGFNRRWFSLAWFDPLRKEPALQKLIEQSPASPANPHSAAR